MNHYNVISFLRTCLILQIFLFATSCNKSEPTALPTVSTIAITNITQTTATGGGDVTSNGGLVVTVRGICYSTSHNPDISGTKTLESAGIGTFTSNLNGLTPNTVYYVRAYATNSLGTSYGNEVSLKTLPGGGSTITDVDGNIYHPIIIGNQDWLKENLKTTHYMKGDPILNVVESNEWTGMDKGAYCVYDKNDANKEVYGLLYNWFAANDTRNICPDGWHVPSDVEWQTLIDYFGSDAVAGGKLKMTGTLDESTGLWRSPNQDASNESGFSALPAGTRTLTGTFELLSSDGFFWSTSDLSKKAWSRNLNYKYGSVARDSTEKTGGLSVRCIKDK